MKNKRAKLGIALKFKRGEKETLKEGSLKHWKIQTALEGRSPQGRVPKPGGMLEENREEKTKKKETMRRGNEPERQGGHPVRIKRIDNFIVPVKD